MDEPFGHSKASGLSHLFIQPAWDGAAAKKSAARTTAEAIFMAAAAVFSLLSLAIY